MTGADNHRKTGLEAESKVAALLKARGHALLERNYYSRFGELDIVSETGGVIVFVEVKYRKSVAYGTPAEAVSLRKRAKIIKTAELYLVEKGLCDKPARFDVAEVYANGEINIIEDAFDLSDGGQF